MGWGIALGILTLLAVLPLGVSASYDAGGAVVKVIAGPAHIKVFPQNKKEKKRKAEKTEQKPEETATESRREQATAPQETVSEPAKEKAGGDLKDFLPLMQIALDFLGDFRRRLRVNVLYLKIIMASDDPADLGIHYGRAWIALGNLWPRLERLFVIKKRDVQVECDFTADETRITARLDLSITLGRLISLVVRYGFRALKEFLKIRKQSKGGATI